MLIFHISQVQMSRRYNFIINFSRKLHSSASVGTSSQLVAWGRGSSWSPAPRSLAAMALSVVLARRPLNPMLLLAAAKPSFSVLRLWGEDPEKLGDLQTLGKQV